MTKLQSYIVKTLPPEMGMDTLRESLTERLPSETRAESHAHRIPRMSAHFLVQSRCSTYSFSDVAEVRSHFAFTYSQ